MSNTPENTPPVTKSMLSLGERWKSFGIVFLDPWVILLLISTIGLTFVSINQHDLIITTTLTILISLFSGVLGGLVSNRWDDLSEEKVIVARAKSATRSLGLLLNSIVNLEKRVRLYIERHNDLGKNNQITAEVVKTYFEETIENCVELEEKVVNSIEDWKDILPNLEVKTVLNVIRELKIDHGNVLAKLDQVNNDLQTTKDKSKEEVGKLEKDKKELEEQVLKIQKELREKSLEVGVPTISGSLITGSYNPYPFIDQKHTFLVVEENGNVVEKTGTIPEIFGKLSDKKKSSTESEGQEKENK